MKRISNISTHAPLARCDRQATYNPIPKCDFNSRTSCEVRPTVHRNYSNTTEFQLTHLLRGATLIRSTSTSSVVISTHAPLARCDAVPIGGADILRISTHAPLARCDIEAYRAMIAKGISTHAPLARCDWVAPWARRPNSNFNSRTSCEVRQASGNGGIKQCPFQLTHLLRGATAKPFDGSCSNPISTHAPLARCDH